MIVANTDVLVDFAAGHGAAATVRQLLARGGLRTTAINRFELLSGARSPQQFARLMQLMDAIPALPLDAESADQASEIRRELEQAGSAIGMADSLIAGIVMRQDATLLTRNLRHFERIAGLKLHPGV